MTMPPESKLLKNLGLVGAVLLIALLATLTLYEEDPCANPDLDISGAVLAEEEEQSAMVNRAIVERAACEQREAKP
ncbi:hypothetical protein EY643_09990 [Halioglobus maricola]|uniref:Uncharacterized protein n=1 Tax=Halioglobus maricola TaxID=2601894 RepID=A0A5P9NKC5_9GAMM|nr:hypothetical protein [Halioglobus maricola]QFU75965.1 hypothetical protein EY643_09990 [Halioglobus maricola]